jgi:signal transduction histidine kinase
MQAIDERMETLGVTSEVGEGTIFTITLPLR